MRIKRVRRLYTTSESLSDVTSSENETQKCSSSKMQENDCLPAKIDYGYEKEKNECCSEAPDKEPLQDIPRTQDTTESTMCRSTSDQSDKKNIKTPKKDKNLAGFSSVKIDIPNNFRRKSFNDVETKAIDSRKVEPLKLSLNRELMKNLPQENNKEDLRTPSPKIVKTKSTTKNETSRRNSYETGKPSEITEKSFPEARVIPKLTIRAGDSCTKADNSDTKHSVVPKLTIRMENPNVDSTLIADSTTAPSPPLPKLRIKTNGDVVESIISTPMKVDNADIQSENSLTVPKLTIRTFPIPGSSKECSSESQNDGPAVPKLTIRTITYKPGFWSPSSSSEDERMYDRNSMKNVYTAIDAYPAEIKSESEINDNNDQELNGNANSPDPIQISLKTEAEKIPVVPKLTIPKNAFCAVNSSVLSQISNTTPLMEHEVHIQHSAKKATKQRSKEDTEDSRKVIILQESHTSNRIPKLMIKQIATGICLVNEVCHKSPARIILENSDIACEREPKLPTDATLPLEEARSQSKQSKILLQSIENVETVKRVPKIRIKTAPNVIFGKRIPRVLKSRLSRDRMNLNVVRKGKIPIILLKRLRQDLLCPSIGHKVPKLKIRSVKNKFKTGFVLVNNNNQKQCNGNNSQHLTVNAASPRDENNSNMSWDGFTSPAVSLAARSTLMSSSEDETDARSELSQIATLQTEAHVLPKLTIRASENSEGHTTSDITHSVVPKLTIKMDCSNKQERRQVNKTLESMGKSMCKPCIVSIPKLSLNRPSTEENETQTAAAPKLTIKTIPGKFSSAPCRDGIQNSNDASSNQKYIMTDCGENTIPRITIKTLPEVKEQTNQIIPKLVIRKKKKKSSSKKAKKSSKSVSKFTVKAKSNDKLQAIPKLRISKRGNNKCSSICTRSCQKQKRVPKIKITQRKVRFDNIKYMIGKNYCAKKHSC